MPFKELGCRCRSEAALPLEATDISPIPSGRETSKPNKYGDEISGMLAATAVVFVAEVEKAEGKNKTFELENDL